MAGRGASPLQRDHYFLRIHAAPVDEDERHALVADEMQSKGTVNHTPLYVREVVKRAPELGASALIMAHSNPSLAAT